MMKTHVTATARGWYHAVSGTVGSSTVQEAVELGELWAAIPDLVRTPLPNNQWTKAALVLPHVDNVFTHVVGSTAQAGVLFDPFPPDLESAQAALGKFPTAGPAVVAHMSGSDMFLTQHTASGIAVHVHFSRATGDQPLLQSALIEERAPQYRFVGEHWLIPAMSGGVLLTPLMAWWALLFGLSMLARYHPASWVHALDVNRSSLAVPLEDALDQAMTAVPHLVLEALLQRPVLVSH